MRIMRLLLLSVALPLGADEVILADFPGGFIQVRLRHEKGRVDASPRSGIEITVDAVPGGAYFVHLRTSQTSMPWSYFGAPLEWPGGKVTLRIPWSASAGVSMGNRALNPETPRSVAIVAAERDFQADIRIYRLSLYR